MQLIASIHGAESYQRKISHTTHHREFANSVTILRERHPFEGRSLQVMDTVRRNGIRYLLVVLPNGSRSLIPATWTDWQASGHEDRSLTAADAERRERCLASLNDLLHARKIVDALLGRCPIPPAQQAADGEDSHAMDLQFLELPQVGQRHHRQLFYDEVLEKALIVLVRMLAQASERAAEREAADE